jgi:hypothetical protein
VTEASKPPWSWKLIGVRFTLDWPAAPGQAPATVICLVQLWLQSAESIVLVGVMRISIEDGEPCVVMSFGAEDLEQHFDGAVISDVGFK